jgi:hypothetical protein
MKEENILELGMMLFSHLKKKKLFNVFEPQT